MKKSLCFIPVMLVLCGVVIAAEYPQWFVTRGVISPEQPTNDYAPANQGHVKWVASKAYEEFAQKLPSADLAKLQAMIDSFPDMGNSKPANLGMLKSVATPFYEELITAGYVSTYPWADGAPADYNVANQGQLKNLFAFNLDLDLDADGLVDWWALQNNVSGGDMDADGDGLTNALEYQYGSNPNIADADSDGLSDLQEYELGTNPNHADSDGDGIDDNDEVSLGLNPVNPDSDGDGLTDGEEVNHSVYTMIPLMLDWDEASSAAEVLGGHLATITSQEENSWISTAIGVNNLKKYHVWIGASDVEEEGAWKWVFGEDFNFENWHSSQPDNNSKRAHYAFIEKSKQQWFDGYGTKSAYLLEFDSGTDPLVADTDGDGLLDGDEVKIHHTCALHADIDGDGLSDADEIAAGTSPVRSDSDRDGLSDSEELVGPTDPLNADTDGDGLLDGPELYGSIYYPVFEMMHWHEAKEHAERLGGHLATITSENEHLNGVLSLGPNLMNRYNFWLGASDEALETNWQWVTGEEFDYTHWKIHIAYAAPDNKNNEDYLEYFRGGAYEWNDVSGSCYRPFLMELDASLDPLNPDCDGDGIPDGEEISKGMNPVSLDSDGDGISDAEEQALGLHGGLLDSDFDGLQDPEELAMGCDPLNPDSDSDGLLDGEEVSITLTDPLGTNSVPDAQLVLSVPGRAAFNRERLHVSTEYIEEEDDLIITSLNYNPSCTWSITNNTAGMYRLALQIESYKDNLYEHYRFPVEISINGYVIGETLAVTDRGALAEGFVYTPWLDVGVYEIKCKFFRMFPHGFSVRIHGLELYAINGTDSNGDGIDDWVQARFDTGLDSDGDGISDWDERFTQGTDLLRVDSDGDGLTDQEELQLGTDPNNADSDGDGVSDGEEVLQTRTNPLVAEFDGTYSNVQILSGAEAAAFGDDWSVDGAEALSTDRRGWLEIPLTFPTNEMYCLSIHAAHGWAASAGSPVATTDTSHFQIYVDDLYVGRYPLVSADGAYADVRAFLPVMQTGEHTVRIFWDNMERRLSARISSIALLSLGGPDANGNGMKDWMEAALDTMTGIDTVTQSFISPACIEGDARYISLMTIAGGASSSMTVVKQSVGDRWYTNLPLATNGLTTATATFQNGAWSNTLQVEWTPYNLLENDGHSLQVRQGDQVRFLTRPEGATNGTYSLAIFGETFQTTNLQPMIVEFDEPGTFSVDGTYGEGASAVSGSINVQVFAGGFPEPPPICLVDIERTWSCTNLPSAAVVQVDEAVQIVETVPTNQMADATALITRQFNLYTEELHGMHTMVARLAENGPILASTPIKVFDLTNNPDGVALVVDRFGDNELWEVGLFADNLPDGVEIHVDIFAGGVTFDDYSLSKIFTKADLDENGQVRFRMFHPNDRAGSICYNVKIYVDGQLIGNG